MKADPPLETLLSGRLGSSKMNSINLQAIDRPKPPSLLHILRAAIGKNVQDPLPLPVELSEPSSNLMKRAEDLTYSELLDEAAKLPKGSVDRLLKVAAFALSPYSASSPDRTGSPLFSQPGETLELVLPEKGLKFISENIYQDGWNIAFHAEGREWSLAADDQARPLIHANSTDFQMRWFLELTFKDGEVFTWSKVITTVNNILSGPMFVSHHGQLEVQQAHTARTALIQFKDIPTLAFTTKSRKLANAPVEGYVHEKGQRLTCLKLEGSWRSHLEVHHQGETPKLLWTADDCFVNSNSFFMTAFAASLVPLGENHRDAPATDTRRRADLRYMLDNQWKQAEQAKTAVQQRGIELVQSARQTAGNSIPAAWFQAVPDAPEPGKGIRFRYAGGYWGSTRATDMTATKFFLDA